MSDDLVLKLRMAANDIHSHGLLLIDPVATVELLRDAANEIARLKATDQFGTPPAVTQVTPPKKLHRETDPKTSKWAAEAASKRSGGQRMRVWTAINQLGNATDFEIDDHIGILRTSAAKRRQELTEAGLVVDSGRRRQTDTGTFAIVWVPVYTAKENANV
jgi:hypothetical protein